MIVVGFSRQPVQQVDGFLFDLLSQAGIAEGRTHGLVPKQLLHVLQGAAMQKHLTCKRVPKVVKMKIHNPGLFSR